MKLEMITYLVAGGGCKLRAKFGPMEECVLKLPYYGDASDIVESLRYFANRIEAMNVKVILEEKINKESSPQPGIA